MHRRTKILLLVMALGAMAFTAREVISYGSGAGSCTYPASLMGTVGNSGTGGFTITVEDGNGPVTEYTPGETYTVTLSNSTTPYRGFLLQSVQGSPGAPNTNGVGTFSWTGDYQSGPCLTATSAVAHNSLRRAANLSSDTFTWEAPAAGTGDVTFHAVGVVSVTNWFGRSDLITTTLTEGSATAAPVPTLAQRVRVHPNPFNPRTTLTVDVRNQGPVLAEVYDARGQLLRTLWDGPADAGPLPIVFDGMDQSGLELSSGVYFYRVQTGEGVSQGKLALVR